MGTGVTKIVPLGGGGLSRRDGGLHVLPNHERHHG